MLIPQPHGGALLSGGQPGQAPGPGRPPSEVRELLRRDFYENLPKLHAIAGDETTQTGDRLRAMDLQAKYGLGALSEISVDTVRDRVCRTLAVIRETLPEDEAERLIVILQPIWTA